MAPVFVVGHGADAGGDRAAQQRGARGIGPAFLDAVVAGVADQMHAGVGIVVAPGVDVFTIKIAVGVDHRHQIIGQLEGFVLGTGAGGRAHLHLVDAEAAVDPVGAGVGALAAAVAHRVAVAGAGQVLELDDAAVIGVRHVEVAVQVGAHAARTLEVINAAAVVAEAAQHVVQGELAGAGVDAENLDAVVAVVRHVEIGGAVVR